MLRRRGLQAASLLLREAQHGSSPWAAGLARQAAPAAAAAAWRHPSAAALLHPHCGGSRWHSELVQRKPGEPESDVVYEGPFSNAVKRVKNLSLFSCACALAAGPVILGLDATTSATAKVSIVGTLAVFGVFTTGLLSWFTQPYVQQLRYDRGTDTVEATTLTLLARPRTDRFHVSEVAEAQGVHPLTTFQARGRRYYIDAEHFPNKSLLARLVPQTAAAHVMDAANAASQAQHAAEQQAAAAARAAGQQQQQHTDGHR